MVVEGGGIALVGLSGPWLVGAGFGPGGLGVAFLPRLSGFKFLSLLGFWGALAVGLGGVC